MKKIIKKIIKKIENLLNIIIIKQYNVEFNASICDINGILKIYNAGKFVISKNTRINSKYSANPIGGQTFSSFFVREGAFLSIGENCGISNSTIVCFSRITIKRNVFIGGGCRIYDTDFHSLDYIDRNEKDENVKSKDVLIDDNAFIGAFTIILKGVTIGKNSIVGAGSVVARNIPSDEIWAGNPAVKIRDIAHVKKDVIYD